MAPNNFLQFNPTAANQESDATYAADTMRTGGAANPSILPSALANKIFYQSSSFIAALAQALANKGYPMSDVSIVNLAGVLANVITAADLSPYALLASPALSGTPTAPTPAASDNSATIPNTAWVDAYFARLASVASTYETIAAANSEAAIRAAADSAEATARANADTAEANTRYAADIAEGSARAGAVNAEAGTRAAADLAIINAFSTRLANGYFLTTIRTNTGHMESGFAVGTNGNGFQIPLPDGSFTYGAMQAQISLNHVSATSGNQLDNITLSVDGSGVLTCAASDNSGHNFTVTANWHAFIWRTY